MKGRKRRERTKQNVRLLVFAAAGILFLTGCLNRSLILISIAVVTMSVLDLIHGNIWWLGHDWDEDPNSEIARIVAVVSLIVGVGLFVLAVALLF